MRNRRIAATILLVALTMTPALAQQKAGGLVKGGKSPDLSLIYTGDVIGFIEPCG